MSLALYMDVHVDYAITRGLRRRGVDVLTAQEDGTDQLTDPELLDRATSLGRVLVTQDTDLPREAARRQAVGEAFAGVIYGRQQAWSVGRWVTDLELVVKVLEPSEAANQVIRVPV